MTGIHRFLAAVACLVPCIGLAQVAPAPADCAGLAGAWSGKWSQGYYGTQWIHVTEVSEKCVATVGYSASEAPPKSTLAVPVDAGVLSFTCNRGTAGTCRFELKGDELRATYSDPTGFVNSGVFRKTH